jgi:hypothetical protein
MFYSLCERKITENLEKIARRNFYGQYKRTKSLVLNYRVYFVRFFLFATPQIYNERVVDVSGVCHDGRDAV